MTADLRANERVTAFLGAQHEGAGTDLGLRRGGIRHDELSRRGG